MSWQPIETAPKDGIPILIAGGRLHHPLVVRWCAPVKDWLAEPLGNKGFGYLAPTMWFQIPPPPEKDDDV